MGGLTLVRSNRGSQINGASIFGGNESGDLLAATDHGGHEQADLVAETNKNVAIRLGWTWLRRWSEMQMRARLGKSVFVAVTQGGPFAADSIRKLVSKELAGALEESG
jgi:hypothetical protein